MNQIPGPYSGHPHHSLAHDFADGVAAALIVRWIWGNPRHPWVQFASLVGVLPAFAAGVFLPYLVLGPSKVNLLFGIAAAIACLRFPDQYNRREDRLRLQAAVARERAYRARYRAKLKEVCAEPELQRIDPLWDVERSFADEDHWSDLAARWFAANPPKYPSQAQAQSHGLLCRCDPRLGGHECLRDSGVANLGRAEAELRQATPDHSWLYTSAIPKLEVVLVTGPKGAALFAAITVTLLITAVGVVALAVH